MHRKSPKRPTSSSVSQPGVIGSNDGEELGAPGFWPSVDARDKEDYVHQTISPGVEGLTLRIDSGTPCHGDVESGR